MSLSELSGKVQTVLGPIDPGQLGITLTHEHLLLDLDCYLEVPEEASERAWVSAPVSMDRLGGLPGRLGNLDKLRLLDEQTAIEEVLEFLIDQGHLDQILVSQDVCRKIHLVRGGGKGYAHILESIVPRMRRRGFTEEQVSAILVENPKRAPAFR